MCLPSTSDGSMLRCKCCEEYFHPNCLEIEVGAEMHEKAADFKCGWCDPYIALRVKSNEKKEKYQPAKMMHSL